mgnify:CR=1 FL=1
MSAGPPVSRHITGKELDNASYKTLPLESCKLGNINKSCELYTFLILLCFDLINFIL